MLHLPACSVSAMLQRFFYMWHAAALPVASCLFCMLHLPSCTCVCVACCMLHVAFRLLRMVNSRCILSFACCMSVVACHRACKLHCVSHAVCCAGRRMRVFMLHVTCCSFGRCLFCTLHVCR
jgi:hypothetical protein